ncbi:hypothetical protein [Mycobacterium sp.]|uniref:hypothetical protein n=1 Tax=Mycobacterium sp. TaxID=1785 RepID=UPI003D0C5E6E
MSDATAGLQSQTPPEWIVKFFHEIDTKRFGPDFDCFTADGEMTFGVGHWVGLAQIKAKLQEFDRGIDTKHTVTEFYDGGPVKIVRGEVTMKRHDGGDVVTPAMVHIFYMADNDATKVRAVYGAVGPTSL